MVENGSIVQVSLSDGGVPKLAVDEAVVGREGIAGDRQRDTQNHGGPERALCLFAEERIEALRAEGHPIVAGGAGENITTRGIDWDAVVPGRRLRLGDTVEIEVTRYTSPCKNIAGNFDGGDFNRMNQKTNPGWSRVYARVLAGGTIRAADPVTFSE
jgi:MOSC domain-containing protein YiiM